MALLKYDNISKRKNSINIIKENKDSYSRYQKCKTYLERVKNNVNNIDYNIFHEYMNYLKESNDIVTNISKPLNLISICNENKLNRLSNQLFNDYIDLCYCVENLDISSLIDRYNLTDKQYNKLLETNNIIQVSDRILNNHSIISERFNINKYISQVPYKGLDKVLETVCPMIDTFNIPDYQRYSATIEECWYALESNHISYNKSELVSLITEYYLLASSELESTSKKGFRATLKKSYILEDEDCCRVEYIINPDSVESKPETIREYINKYLSLNDKSIDLLDKICIDAINNVSNDNFVIELPKIIWLYWKTIRFETFEDCDVIECIDSLYHSILYNIENRDLTKETIRCIVEKLTKLYDLLIINNNSTENEIKQINLFKQKLQELIQKISDFSDMIYYEYNLDIINQINESNDIISLDEFKLFKFNNLIAAFFRANKFLKNKEKNLFNSVKYKIKKKIKKVKDILFPENVDVNYFLNNNGIAETCIVQYKYDDSSVNEMQDYLYETCKELNQQTVFDKIEGIKFFYIMNPGIGEIHIASTSKVDLTEEEQIEVQNTYCESNNIYIDEFANLVNYMDILENVSIDDLLFRINETKNNLNLEELNVALEALEIFGIDSDILRPISESYNSSIKSENENNFYSIDIRLEAYDIFEAIMEKGAPKIKKVNVGPSNKSNSSNKKLDKDDKEAKENKFSGISFNKIKLALLGLKAKAKDFGQKASEFTKNLDMASTRFMKSLKSAMISDSREGIIKGSVIPSFSKCIKIGIALAGSYVISGFNPITPVILAIGGFAVSKNLTEKERVLLLDEIETEIQVLDKEIQLAESNNKMKRLRALLKQKKELQRQYQRIKYNIRVGKDILPGSATGVPNSED